MGKRFYRNALSIAFLIMLVSVPAIVSAQVEKYIDVVDGADFLIDSTVNVFDDKVDSSIWSTIDTVYYSKGVLVFEINPDIPFYLPDTFFCDLTLSIKTYDSTNTLIGTDTKDMVLRYDTVKNKPYSNRSVLYFDNVYRIEATYTHIDYSQGNGNLIPPEIFRLSAQINVLRTYNFDCDSAPDIGSATYETVHDRVEVSWAPFPGATGYDFEWTFFDDSSEVVKKMSLGYLNFDSLFRFNSTRITLDGTSASIPVMYTSGYLFYRVRAIKVLPGFQNLFSEWTSDDDDKFAVNWHEGTLTWQSSISFAEEGKRKEVISYFDGSLRNRQTVTRINQVDTAVVAETIYDFQGRPAVKVLPAPAFDPQIKYYPKFNVDANGDYYTWVNFDTASCGNTPDFMDSISGASRYYSPTNPLYTQAPYKYIPDAEGYPFSVTEYTGDNTGRISRQSGVGPYLMFNDSVHRETRYFYGKPSQYELDRLFGNDVGDSSHYTEEMVIDPNGQISISYKDAHDRVVATALAGSPPANLIQLPEYMPDDTLRTFLRDNNRIEDKSWISSTNFLAKSQGDFTFYYNLFPDFLQITNCDTDSICYDCYYDILISVGSTCSATPFENTPLVSRSYKNYQLPRNDSIFYDTLCVTPDSNLLDSFVLTLDPGSYFISRKITVSDSAIAFYTEKFVRENACSTFETFYQNELAGLDSSGCVTCETCFDQLGDTTEFFTSFFSEWDTIVPTHDDTAKALVIYIEAYQNCELLCSPFDDCSMREKLMLNDFTPGAQYARYETHNGPPMSNDASSVLYWNGTKWRFQEPGDGIIPYLDESGNEIKVLVNDSLKSIEELTSEQFVTYYDPSWATALLKLHPEYCYLKFCEANSGAHEYFTKMLSTNSYDEALASGLTDPLGPSNADPFFQTEYGVSDSSLMRNRIEQYKYVDFDMLYTPPLNPDTSCHNRVMSMWDLGILTAIKGILPAGYSDCDTIDINTLCTGDKNIAWMVFRALYIHVRDSIYQSKEWDFVTDTTTCERASANGNCCIGSNNDRYQMFGHYCHSGGSYCTADYFDKTPRFYHLNPGARLNWENFTEASGWATHEKEDSACASICHGHRGYWERKLQEYCGFIDTLTLDTLLDMFQEICEHGCDHNHALGSSTVPPGDALVPGTFQEAMEYVLGISPTNPTCNAVLIDMPRPYENQGKISASDIAFPKPSECTCEKFDSLFMQMIIDTAGTTLDSFAVYLTVNYGSLLTVDQLYQIKLHCHDTLCKNMTEPIILPPVLSCGACLPCDSVNNAFTDFKDFYADVLASPDINALLGGYLNIRFGFHLQPVDYIQFIVDCNIDTSGSNLITCDSIRTLFAEYISSAPTVSLDHWLDSALNLNYSYTDYSMWIFNCAFDTINGGFIPCDTLIKYRNEFYTTGLPADSFVIWMNDTLYINYTYLQYAAWIANCDSTDSIPYSGGMSMRMAHNGSQNSSGSFNTQPQKKGSQQRQPSKKSGQRSKEQIKAEFEKALEKRNISLNPGKQSHGVSKNQGIDNLDRDTSRAVPEHKKVIPTSSLANPKRSRKDLSFLSSSFLQEFQKEADNKKQFSTLTASLNSDLVVFEPAQEVFMSPPMPGFCDDLADALIVYDSIAAGFHPPLALWLNNYLDTTLTYSAWVTTISGCSLDMPAYSLECDSLQLHFDTCRANVAMCVIHTCLNEVSGLDFSIHEYLQWFDSCGIDIVACDDIDTATYVYNNLDPDLQPPLTVFLHNYFDLNLTYAEWMHMITDCGDSIISSSWSCDSLQAVYDYCAKDHAPSVTSCLYELTGFAFTWTEFATWLDSCGISYLDCEKLNTAITAYNALDSALRPPLVLWLNHTLDLDWDYEVYEEYLENCEIPVPYSEISCDSLLARFESCISISPSGVGASLNSTVVCLNDYFNLDFTLIEYIDWLDTCNIPTINCDTLDSVLAIWKLIHYSIRPPLTVYLNSSFGLSLSYEDYLTILRGCIDTIPGVRPSCDSIETIYMICSEMPPYQIADCMNDLIGINFTLHEYWQWLDSCNVDYDSTISCANLPTAVHEYPCWQDSITIFEWINFYFDTQYPDSIILDFLDSCNATPVCCGLLQELLFTFNCDSITVYQYLNDTLGVSLSNAFWQNMLDSCGIDEPCDSCNLLQLSILDFPCQDTISFLDWTNNMLGWNLTDSSLGSLLEFCRYTMPCPLSCEQLQLALSEMCSYTETITIAEWLNHYFRYDYSDSTWMAMIDSCHLILPCLKCPIVLEAEAHYPCNSGIPITQWLNDALGLNYTELEWTFFFIDCPVDTIRCICEVLDTLHTYYPCQDSLSLYQWLDTQTGWGFSDLEYLTYFRNCGIYWYEDCVSCDSLASLESDYPCNSGIPLYSWLNDSLNLSYTELEWDYIFSYCPIDTMHCICPVLDSLVPLYSCNDTLSLTDWLNTQTGWGLPGGTYLYYLLICGISWDTMCVSCESLQVLEDSYPCNTGIPIWSWLNDTLNLSYSFEEWSWILAACPLDTSHCVCTQLDSLVHLYPCNDSLSLTQWLDSQTGWNYWFPYRYFAFLDSCHIVWDTLCVTCDSIQAIEDNYPCNSGIRIETWLNQELNLNYSIAEWQHIFINCPFDTLHCICPTLDSLVLHYPCHDSLSLSQWLNSNTGWHLDDNQYIAYLDSCDITWDTLCVTCDTLQAMEYNYPCNSGIPIEAWLNDTLNLSFSYDEWQHIFINCPVDTLQCICPQLDSIVEMYPCNDTLSLSDWLNTQTGWNFSDTTYIGYLDSCKINWVNNCVMCDTLQQLTYVYPCNSGVSLSEWFNTQLNLSYSDYEWEAIIAECRIDSACDSCSLIDSLITQYPCNDTLSLSEWMNLQTGWSKTDTQYISMLDSCDLYDLWQAQCDSCHADFTFTYDSLNCHTIHFYDQSTSSIAVTSYLWYLGVPGGTTSTLKNPTYTFSVNDTFTVCLVITHRDSSGNFLCTDSICKDVTIVATPTVNISVDSSSFCEGQTHTLVASGSAGVTYQWNPGGSTNDSLAVSVAGTYTVTVFNGYCFASDPQVIALYDTVPPIIVLQGSSHICTGIPLFVLADMDPYNAPALQYLWSTMDTTQYSTFTTAGTYCLTVLDAHGCYVHDCVVLTESAPPPPPVIIGPADTINLCSSDGGITFDGGDSLHCINYTTGLAWNDAITTGPDIFVFYDYGFTVTYTDSNGCSSTSNTIYAIGNLYSTIPDSLSSDHYGNLSCSGNAVVITQYGGVLGIPGWSLTPTTYWAWYADSCGGTLVDTGASITVHPVTTTTYYVRAEGPCGTECDSITIEVAFCDSCVMLDSLIQIYNCNDSLSLVEWLEYNTSWNISDSAYLVMLDSCGIVWDTLCIPDCAALQELEQLYPCNDSLTLTAWLNDTLGLSYSDLEWDTIFSWCPPDTSHCICLELDSLLPEYPCQDSLSLSDWLNSQTGWGWSDTIYQAWIDSCDLDSLWITSCVPSCDSLQALEHVYPCDTSITLEAWLNATLGLAYSDVEWDSIFVWCPPDTICGIDSCEILSDMYNEWDSVGTYGPLETWLNDQLQLNLTYWDYLQLLDSCGGVVLPIPCDTIDSLLSIYIPLPEPKFPFRIWANHELGLDYSEAEFSAVLDSCDTISPPPSCDTLDLYVDYFLAYHPAQNIFAWLNDQLGISYSLYEYLQWFDTCVPQPPLCDYFDSLYTYYEANADTVPLEVWFNDQTGLNYTYWQYIYLLEDCFPVPIPCDTLLYVWNLSNNLPIPIPFYLYANNYWGLNYTPEWYCYLLDSCGIYSGPCDTSSCDSLQLLYNTYDAIMPHQDLTTWMNDTLGLNFSYWEYVQWFDTCIYLPIPCDTISELYSYYSDNHISTPFADWMNDHLNVNYSLLYYQHLLDSCNIVERCDSLDMAVSAYLAQPDTSVEFTDFMNSYLGWSLTFEQYQSELSDCHHDTTLWLCDGGIVEPIPDSVFSEDCLDDFLTMAFSNAQHNYDLYLDSLKGAFVDQYTSHCLNSFNEDFYVDGPFSEYHYTLYYYDQAGNLAQTIPPNGVVPFNDPDTLEDIAEFRNDPYGASLPIYRSSSYSTHYTYNTLNKPVGQHTPDADSAHFWYDWLGRLVFSRNAQQRLDAVMSMSYTVYDDLGRIAEVGKMDSLPYLGISDEWARDTFMVNFYLENSHRTEITHTYYDAAAFSPSPGFEQDNLRNRVASVTWENNNDHDSLTFDFATHYTYDITGNVKTILQETPLLAVIGQNLKRIDYDYDLVSGKVNYVYYQKDSIDQFIHHYEYDDDNRITHVYTSRDNMLWDEDAHYEYYLHGPLARVELGQQKVQGVDYAYTLQGWMKGINASTLYPDRDMGGDGQSLTDGFSRDAYGFSLGYFYQDYKQIDPTVNWQADYTTGSTFGDSSFGSATNLGLYNGNIRHTVLSMDSMNYPNIGYVYQYDQLNRLKGMNAYADLDTVDNEWGPAAVLDDYKELIDFDPNGNILNYLRRGTSTGGHTIRMDSLSYTYNSGNNKLDHVSDNSGYTSNYPDDIDAGQSGGNYDYDANGNLIADASEGLTMTWWNNGKLKSVSKALGDTLNFFYDPSGNRTMKKHFSNTSGDTLTTVYIRDAQGNIMATYEWKNNDSLRLNELDIYGSSRIGMLNEDTLLSCLGCITATSGDSATLYTGKKLYELTNHLGNVLSTISDKKVYVDADANDTADYSVPEIASQQDYYPFGMLMPGRKISFSEYKFGFNGMENDDEVKGQSNSIDFGARIYDSRLGRWLSIDPKGFLFPSETYYGFVKNSPILKIDIDGKVDYSYTVRTVKNEDNSLTKIVDVKVIYKTVNLSSQEVTGANFAGVQNTSTNLFNYESKASEINGVSNVKINISVEFKLENNFENIKDGENALLIVDKLQNVDGKDVVGRASLTGNVAVVEVGTLLDASFTALVLHEVGHNLGLNHENVKGNLMNQDLCEDAAGRGGTDLNKDQLLNQTEHYYNNIAKTNSGKVSEGGVIKKAKDFIRKHVEKYNAKQAAKVNFKLD